MTYQAASGAGANNMRELLKQMGSAHASVRPCLMIRRAPSWTSTGRSPSMFAPMPTQGVFSAFRWHVRSSPGIDKQLENGQSKEEWKGQAETNKILGREGNPVPIDGTLRACRCYALSQPGAHH